MVEENLDGEPLWMENPPTVAAIVVAHRAERWLPTVLESHARLDFKPDTWIAVHDGTDARTTEILTEHFHSSQIIAVKPGLGFGEKVAAATASLPQADWYWLLHDDVIVGPGTLTGLLNEATSSDDIGAVGPKIREWPSLRRLLEVGVTITGTGHRETGLEPGEPDAGQYDRPRDVLAVGTAGMLVRGSVWRALGGLDPNLPLFGDDIDFGWRLNRAGWRVRTAPESIVFHAEASRSLRRNRRGGVRPRVGERRAAGLYTVLANESSKRVFFVWLRLFFGSLIRSLGFLIGKDFRAFQRELAAVLTVFFAPKKLREARAARKPFVERTSKELAHLRPSFWHPYLHGLEIARAGLINIIKPEETPIIGHRAVGMTLDERDLLMPEQPAPMWRRWPWLTVVVLLGAAAIISGRSLPPGRLYSSVLLGAPSSVFDWWALIVSRAHDVGVGSVDWPTTAVIPMAMASNVVWFSPGLTTWILLIFAVPLAAMTAHRFGRQLTDDRIPRMIWAISYGLLVATSGAVAGGRLGTVVALILVPVIASSLWRLVEEPRLVKVAQTAFVIAVAAAFAPIMWWICLVVLGVLAWRWATLRKHFAIVMVVASVLLGPAMWTRVLAGARVWWEAGTPVAVNPSVVDVAFGLGGTEGQAPWWVMISVLIVGVIALVPRETRWSVTIAWIFATVMLAFALVASAVSFTPSSRVPEVSAWGGLPAALWLAGLLTAALFAAPAVRMRRYRQYTRLAFALILIFPILGLGWFMGRGIADPLTDVAPPAIPAYLTDAQITTLVLTGDLNEGIVAQVVNKMDGVFGTESMGPNDARTQELKLLVESLLSGPTVEDVEALGDLGIGAIYSPRVDANTERRMDAVPGLSPAGTDTAQSRVWMVTADVASEPVDRSTILRPLLGFVWLLVWLIVTVLALPFAHTVTEEEEQ